MAAEALMVEPLIKHQAAAIMLAAIVIAAGRNDSTIFIASFEVVVREGYF